MSAALSLLDALSKLMFWIACALVVMIVCVVTYDVASRNLGLPTAIWAVNSVEYAMLHITFLCFPWLVRTRGHVCVEVLLTYLPAGLRRLWQAGLQILAALIAFYLMYHSGKSFFEVLTDGSYEVRAFDAPMWMLYASMPLGFGLGALQFLSFFPRHESFYGAPPEAHAGL
ncbi:TRAP transporter small permease [Celeribacter persicus]|uniref:TRAP transporter small permease protein n=1 Tax=Celeribacter persicus TaxID=1651082 RepID=A0A2T5HUR5_9RHOB|nr:TRAP transporter small permease subunit [Celeribacter persicus]PTQ75321.1 TRAP-type C4-dicarboxylate transport system permease small subunit [Celeribacter persicus]